jgi:hypothetical protein
MISIRDPRGRKPKREAAAGLEWNKRRHEWLHLGRTLAWWTWSQRATKKMDKKEGSVGDACYEWGSSNERHRLGRWKISSTQCEMEKELTSQSGSGQVKDVSWRKCLICIYLYALEQRVTRPAPIYYLGCVQILFILHSTRAITILWALFLLTSAVSVLVHSTWACQHCASCDDPLFSSASETWREQSLVDNSLPKKNFWSFLRLPLVETSADNCIAPQDVFVFRISPDDTNLWVAVPSVTTRRK